VQWRMQAEPSQAGVARLCSVLGRKIGGWGRKLQFSIFLMTVANFRQRNYQVLKISFFGGHKFPKNVRFSAPNSVSWKKTFGKEKCKGLGNCVPRHD